MQRAVSFLMLLIWVALVVKVLYVKKESVNPPPRRLSVSDAPGAPPPRAPPPDAPPPGSVKRLAAEMEDKLANLNASTPSRSATFEGRGGGPEGQGGAASGQGGAQRGGPEETGGAQRGGPEETGGAQRGPEDTPQPVKEYDTSELDALSTQTANSQAALQKEMQVQSNVETYIKKLKDNVANRAKTEQIAETPKAKRFGQKIIEKLKEVYKTLASNMPTTDGMRANLMKKLPTREGMSAKIRSMTPTKATLQKGAIAVGVLGAIVGSVMLMKKYGGGDDGGDDNDYGAELSFDFSDEEIDEFLADDSNVQLVNEEIEKYEQYQYEQTWIGSIDATLVEMFGSYWKEGFAVTCSVCCCCILLLLLISLAGSKRKTTAN